MRNFRIDATVRYYDSNLTTINSVFCSEANLDIWKSSMEEAVGVSTRFYDGRRGEMVSYTITEIDPQPEVKGAVTSNRGIL